MPTLLELEQEVTEVVLRNARQTQCFSRSFLEALNEEADYIKPQLQSLKARQIDLQPLPFQIASPI